VGGFIWRRCDGRHSLDAIVAAMVRDYDVAEDTARSDVREFLADRGEGYVATESELERMFANFVVAYALPMPRRQVTVIKGRVDFLFDPGMVIAELDGRRNHTALLDREADMERDARLTAMGLKVIRITHRRLTRDPDGVYVDLRDALRLAA